MEQVKSLTAWVERESPSVNSWLEEKYGKLDISQKVIFDDESKQNAVVDDESITKPVIVDESITKAAVVEEVTHDVESSELSAQKEPELIESSQPVPVKEVTEHPVAAGVVSEAVDAPKEMSEPIAAIETTRNVIVLNLIPSRNPKEGRSRY